MALAYGTIDAAAETTRSLVAGGGISPEQARTVQAWLERAFALNNTAAREVIEGRPQDAEGTLALVQRLLDDVAGVIGGP